MQQQALRDRIRSPGQKRILACDGGGILGMMTVEILHRVEHDLRRLTGKPELVLGDWFDFVCGTSTGAIIAACVASGMSTTQIRRFYLDSGRDMFDRAALLKRLRYSYNDEPLARKLQAELNLALNHRATPVQPFATLGDDKLRSLLMMVLRNHTTDSPWPVSNNPFGKYNQRERADCNLDLPLWQLVRASTAAPTFFPPEVVTFAPDTADEYQFVFVDGGVTTYNNPAFLAFQMATSPPYGIAWPTGADRLLLVSVGTGCAANARPDLEAGDLWLLDHARNIPSALMNAAAAGWDMACRTLGECRFGAPVDKEFGAMQCAPGSRADALFAYVRFDPDVSRAGLDALDLRDIDAAQVREMDSTRHLDEIRRVGVAFAERHVDIETQFAGFLD
jgi:predicted acylesterase/phospholipase RssA